MNDPSSHGRSTPPPAKPAAAGPAPTVSMPPQGVIGGRAGAEAGSRDPLATYITSVSGGKRPAAENPAPAENWRFLPGDKLGDYELIDFVGGGGMGRVYRARDARLARIVALKLLAPDQAADEATLLRFQNEAQSAARLDHQNIARVYNVGESHGVPFIAFEFVEGLNIRELVLKKGPFSLAEALGYILQITEGLAHAASRNVVHRDIKPSNVIVTPDGTAKLIDLGLARLHRLEPGSDDLTASGVTLGTFDYISPEQARDPRTADTRSDIYSLGCTFFFMFTGRPPFPEGTMLQKLLQHQGDQPPDVRQIRPDLPEEVGRILRKMLAKDPRHRYQHPAELLEELLTLAEQAGVRSLRAPTAGWTAPEPPRTPFWERHLPWAAPVLILVVIVLGLDFLPSRHDDLPPLPEITAPAQTAAANGAAPQAEPANTAPAPTLSSSAVLKLEPEAPENRVPTASSSAAVASGTAMASPPPAAGTSTAAETPVVARSPATRPGQRVVGEAGADEKKYATLQAACAEAANGDVILLRYQGRQQQQPLTLNNLKLTIRAAEGYHPVVVFRPSDIERARAMLTVSGGHLTLVNVALDLELPRNLGEQGWSLLELLGGEGLRLESCYLTVRGPTAPAAERAPDTAVFRYLPASSSSADGSSAAANAATIELLDSVVRGEATLLRTNALGNLRLDWKNGLLAVSQHLLAADGGSETPRPGDTRQITLRHVTSFTRRSLCRLGMAPQQVPTAIITGDNIFLGESGVPLVEQSGPDPVACRNQLKWNGDRNFYQGWDLFWSIAAPDGKVAETHSYESWLAHWGPENECQSERNQVLWNRLPEASRPCHTHTAADYALLADPSNNPARGAAWNHEDVGFRAAQLPSSPVEPLPDGPQGVRQRDASGADVRLGGLTAPPDRR